MPKLADRVKETTTTTGTGAISMGGAAEGYRAFSAAFTTGDTVYYCIEGGAEWEVGIGTLTTGSPWTMARTTVLASSNAGAAVSFSAGDKNVFCTSPALDAKNGSAVRAVASGAISTGDVVVVNSDGTVGIVALGAPESGTPVVFESASTTYSAATYDSANGKVVIAYADAGNSSYGTAIVGTVSGTSISFGTPVVFESADTSFIAATYDSANGKVVIAYRDNGNTGYGTAVVGTVSGTSISFGTPVVYHSNYTLYTSITYDSANGKVVIAYADNGSSNYGTAIVGTVSGTSISFGTAVVFESATVDYLSAIYDGANGKVVVAYKDIGNSNRGTAIVGTVSGTSISFGTAVVFESDNANHIAATYDSANGKVVIAYADAGNSSYGTAIVGTVSGTSISFGTPVVFESADTQATKATYDSANGKVVVAYKDIGNSNRGTAIVGTVSGTSISFGTAIVFETGSTGYIAATYDSANGKVVVACTDYGNSSYGTSAVLTSASTNATAENILGIAQATVSDTNPVIVGAVGYLDEQQSGLTPGRKYYVANNGSLTLTDTGRYIGKSLAATKLLIGG